MVQSQAEKDGAGVTQKKKINIVHIMADGSTRDSVAGVVIQSEEFYRVIHGIMENQKNVNTYKTYQHKGKGANT